MMVERNKKNIWISLVLCIGMFLVSGCAKNNNRKSETKSHKQKTANATESTLLNPSLTESEFPEYVVELHDSFKDVISQYCSNISLGDIEDGYKYSDIDNSYNGYYTFDVANSEVMVSYFEGDCDGFRILFSDSDSNEVVKNLISIAITASEDCSFANSQEKMRVLTDSFSGDGQSEALVLENCRYLLSKYGDSSIDHLELEVRLREGEDDIDKSQFPDLDAKHMQAPLNQGESGKLCGIVISETYQEFSNRVEIANDEGIFLVFYSPVRFTGEISIGETYIFYGYIAKAQDSYCGCLRLEYLEETEALDIDISTYPSETVETSSGDPDSPKSADSDILYENTDVVIKYLKVDREGVYFDVENLTDKNITVQADSISVNGRSYYDIVMSCDIAPHSIGEVIARCSVDYKNPVRCIGGQLRIVDFDHLSETYEVVLDSIVVNDRIDEMKIEPEGVLLFENEETKIYYKEVNERGVVFEVENLTSKNLTIQADSLSINNRSINDIIMSCDVAPHSIGEVVAHCSIECDGKVEVISGQLRIVDMNTFESSNAKFVDVSTEKPSS